MQNYKTFDGFRLNSESYSAYHGEKEVVLMEGVQMYVLHVEEYIIDNHIPAQFKIPDSIGARI